MIENSKLEQNDNIYLFFGEEKYDLNRAVDTIKKRFDNLASGVNLFYITKDNINELKTICENVTFFGDEKLVIIKNTNLKIDIDLMLENITEGTVVVIIEDQIDKRLAEYKKLSKIAKVTEFKQLTSKEMVNYVIQILGKYNLKISNLDAEYFVDSCGIDKQNNINELQKLVVSSKAQNVITKDMIDKICVKTFNAKLFDMLNNIVNKNKVEAIGQLEQLLMLKESIVKIYVMLYRQIFQIYMIKLFKSSNKITKDIASALGIHPYAFKTLSISAEKYTLDELKNILYMFDKYDEKTKFGDMDFEIGLKKIICNM